MRWLWTTTLSTAASNLRCRHLYEGHRLRPVQMSHPSRRTCTVAVHRLHRRVGEEGHLVGRLKSRRSAIERALEIAFLRAIAPAARRRLASARRMLAELTLAFGPSSHSTLSAATPFFAAQVLSPRPRPNRSVERFDGRPAPPWLPTRLPTVGLPQGQAKSRAPRTSFPGS